MLNQARIDGLLKYMDQIGLSQMLIRNPVLVRYFVGITPRGAGPCHHSVCIEEERRQADPQ